MLGLKLNHISKVGHCKRLLLDWPISKWLPVSSATQATHWAQFIRLNKAADILLMKYPNALHSTTIFLPKFKFVKLNVRVIFIQVFICLYPGTHSVIKRHVPRLSKIFLKQLLLRVYKLYIQSKLDYGLSICGCNTEGNPDLVQRIQIFVPELYVRTMIVSTLEE